MKLATRINTLMTAFMTTFLAITMTAATLQAEDDKDKAKEAFSRGRKLFENEQFPAAAIQFRMAYKINPTWKLMYNIAQCEVGAKHYGLALEAFERYLVEGGDEVPVDRREEIRKETKRLRDMVGMLDIRGPEGAEIFVDGQKRGTLPLSGYIPISASVEHNVTGIYDSNYKLKSRKVKIMTGQTMLIEMIKTDNKLVTAAVSKDDSTKIARETDDAVVAKEATETSGEHQNSDSDNESPAEESDNIGDTAAPASGSQNKPRILRIAGWSAIGLGVAGLATGGITGAMALNKNDTLKKNCVSDYNDPNNQVANDVCVVGPTYNGITKDRDTLATVSTITFIAGGAIAATGIALVIVDAITNKSEGVAWQAAPMVAQNSAGAVLQLSF